MLTLGTVQARGQVTLPKEVRRAAGVKPGDSVAMRVLGPGLVELRVLPTLTLEEMFERYKIAGPIDEARDRTAWQEAAAGEAIGE
jgi:AbrB family looped-hinge helix DNA binding protein